MTKRFFIALLLLASVGLTDAANPSVSDPHALGLVFHTNAKTCTCSCDMHVEMREQESDTSSTLWWSKSYTSGTNEDLHLWLDEKKEGGTTGFRPGVRYACDGLDNLGSCICCNFTTPCGEVDPAWGWISYSGAPTLQADWWDQDGDSAGDGSGNYITHEGRTELYTDFTNFPAKTTTTDPDNVDPRHKQFQASDCVSNGCPVVAAAGRLEFNGNETQKFAISQNTLPEDQYALSYIDCNGCTSANEDHVMNLRRAAGGSDLYQCKFEFFASTGSSGSVKWNAVRSSMPGGFCGQISASAVSGAPLTLPMWARCEVWTDDDDSDGKNETHASIFLASDSAGVPGTWVFMVELRQEVTDGLTCVYGDGTSGSCGSCAGWTAGNPWLGSGGYASWGLAKSAIHRFDNVMAGALVDTPNVRGRRAQ